jgi:dUTP pyrophosphatase
VQAPVHNSNPVVTGEELLALLDPSADREMLAATVRAAVETRTVRIARGDRIAQLIVTRYERPRVQITEALPDSERGLGGFGSTGVAGARV